MPKIIKKKLKIDGMMHCTSCAMMIDMDLEEVEGVKTAKTNYAKQESEVEYDEEEIKLEELIRIIQKTGYTATLASNS